MLTTAPTPVATEANSCAEQYLTFTVQGEEYGIPIDQVREIKVLSETTRLPNTPDYLRGVMNLRGQVLPVFDLRARFHGVPTQVTPTHVVVVLSQGTEMIGLLVDAVLDILETVAGEITPVPVRDLSDAGHFLSGLVTRDARMVALLSAAPLFELTRAGFIHPAPTTH